MAGIQRFVTYIYAYENGKKQSNTGFAKIEVRGNDGRLEIHLHNTGMRRGEGTVALFLEKDGKVISFPVGKMRMINGSGDFGTIMKADKIANSPYCFGNMEGIVITGMDGSLFLSRWKEGNAIDVKTENIHLWEPEKTEETAGTKEALKPKERVKTEEAAKTEDTVKSKEAVKAGEPRKTEEAIKPEKPAEKEAPQQKNLIPPPEPQKSGEDIRATEVPMRNIFPRYNWLEVWENLKQAHPTSWLNGNVFCVRIELKDLRELPKKYWYLGNNSFLLHGFFNYHYLILGKLEEERWFIGVPGIYQHQERVMAAIFGFPEFLPVSRQEGTEEKQTPNEPVNQFGYWFHTLEE